MSIKVSISYGYLTSEFAFNPDRTVFGQGGPIVDTKTGPARPKSTIDPAGPIFP